MPDGLSLSERWRQAALEPYTDAPTTADEWLRALELGADAAVRVVLEGLLDDAGIIWTNGVAVRAVLAARVERYLTEVGGSGEHTLPPAVREA